MKPVAKIVPGPKLGGHDGGPNLVMGTQVFIDGVLVPAVFKIVLTASLHPNVWEAEIHSRALVSFDEISAAPRVVQDYSERASD